MLTNFSLWVIYTASYAVDYVALLIISVLQKRNEYISLNKSAQTGFLKYCHLSDYIVWGVLAGLVLLSIMCVRVLKKTPMNTRTKSAPQDNIVWEIAGYVLAQVVTILTIIFSDYWIVISFIIFIVMGFIFVNSRKVHYSPLFIVPMRYHVFQCDNCVIITNYSKDGLRLAIESDPDGVEARELEDKVYLVRKETRNKESMQKFL